MTVTDVLSRHSREHGASDPRMALDSHCWSYLATWDRREGRDPSMYREIEEWCDSALGNENWFRMFNKFWFTDEQCLTLFKLTWSGGPSDAIRE